MENRNEKALKIIEQQYANFIDLTDKWDFFRGLADYVKTVQELTQTKPFIEALEMQRKLAETSVEVLNTTAMKELTAVAGKMQKVADDLAKHYAPLQKVAEDVAKQYRPIANAMKEVQDQLSGKLWASNPVHHLDSSLFTAARFIKEAGFEEKIKEFENNDGKRQNIYGNYTFSQASEKLPDEQKKFKRKEEVEPWGAWHQLPMIPRFVYDPDEYVEECRAEVKENPDLTFTFYNFLGVAGEMEAIRTGKASENDIVWFKVKDFKSFAQRFHRYITTELVKASTDMKLEFDDTKRILYFMNESIVVSKKEESDPHKLMRTLFKDEQKVWASDEILEDWGYSFDENVSENKVYQAGKKVNSVIAQSTKIKDFLEVSTKSIAINKKYLKT